MTYAAILVHVQLDAPGEARLRCARDLAGRFDAALIGLGAEMTPPLSFDDGYVSADVEWCATMETSINETLEAAGALFKREAAGLSKGALWLAGVELPGPALTLGARRADLIVASPPGRHRPSAYRDATAADLAITSGRPVLVAPTEAPPISADRVVLAWKDTREARRAMIDALPFLQAAKEVLVLEVCAEAEAVDAAARTADVAELLGRHGVATQEKLVHDAGAGEAILAEAKAFEADLIVAGAYGHSRFGEWVFGGVTRVLLAQQSAYLLLSH
jgi:nucleotide-binding universal stress UspA family protein